MWGVDGLGQERALTLALAVADEAKDRVVGIVRTAIRGEAGGAQKV